MKTRCFPARHEPFRPSLSPCSKGILLVFFYLVDSNTREYQRVPTSTCSKDKPNRGYKLSRPRTYPLASSPGLERSTEASSSGGHSYQHKVLIVKMVKYIPGTWYLVGFYVYHRSYLLWSPVIVCSSSRAPPALLCSSRHSYADAEFHGSFRTEQQQYQAVSARVLASDGFLKTVPGIVSDCC